MGKLPCYGKNRNGIKTKFLKMDYKYKENINSSFTKLKCSFDQGSRFLQRIPDCLPGIK